jgi:hypothetical protein
MVVFDYRSFFFFSQHARNGNAASTAAFSADCRIMLV